MATQTIKNFNGKILGFIEEKPNGDKIVRDFYHRLLGKYEKKTNITKDFYGRILGKGDLSMMLIQSK